MAYPQTRYAKSGAVNTMAAMEQEQAQAIVIRPVTEVPWSDTETVFGTRGDPSTCWCQFYKMPHSEFGTRGNSSCAPLLRAQVEEARHGAPVPGLIAYLDSEPVGWVAVEPRTQYPTVFRGKVVADGSNAAAGDDSVWAIVCFVVRVGFRRRGIAGALLTAAVTHAREAGARMIEGYPVDVAQKEKVSSAALYHGTLTLFEGAGFTVVARPIPGRALVALEL